MGPRRLRSFAVRAGIAVAAIIAVQAAALTREGAETARAENVRTPLRLRAIDGDTIIDRASGVTYRIVNVDTPEVGDGARCYAERQLGQRATRRTRELLAGAARIETAPTGRIDRYGRSVAAVLVDGRDLGDILITEGLARPWRGRREPWCDARGRLIR